MCNYVGQGDHSMTMCKRSLPEEVLLAWLVYCLLGNKRILFKCDESLAVISSAVGALEPTMYLASLWASHITPEGLRSMGNWIPMLMFTLFVKL